MAVFATRDIANLRREDLLDDYLKIAKRRKGALVATALRTKSTSMRDILVHGAVGRQLTSEQLKRRLLLEGLDPAKVLDPDLLEDLGRLVILQDILKDDTLFGEKLLYLAAECKKSEGGLAIESRRVLIQHLVGRGDSVSVEKLLDESPDIDQELHGYLRGEVLNPFISLDGGNYAEWLANFNRFFIENGIAPVRLNRRGSQPFDRLTTEVTSKVHGTDSHDPLVSVVLTTYQPNEEHLAASVQSIIEQSWQKLEIILVDDCSGDEFTAVFDRIRLLDSRIKIIHAVENRGTYVARNIGYAASKGDFITGQDDDDWSHPERLFRQVEFMKQNSAYIACRIMAIRADENLGRCRVGYKPIVLNPSSLMIRRDGYKRTGGYLESRKGADSEYYFRLKSVTGGRVANLKEPLSVIRILPESLSRGDFSAGWRHPSRTAFRSAFRYWHRTSSQSELDISEGDPPSVAIPRRFKTETKTSAPTEYDVVFAGDWQRYGGPQKSMLEEVFALLSAGYRVGILNLEAARFMSDGPSEPLNDQIQYLINRGAVGEVFYDENVDVRLLMLRYPPILQFFTSEQSKLRIRSMVVVANQAPAELDGTDIRYLVDECHQNAKTAFGIEPHWIPQGPQVRDFLEYYLKAPVLTAFDSPGILDLDSWWHDRLWYRSTVPVVGRHSRDDAMKWPSTKQQLEEIYRVDGSYDVRIMGGHRTPLRVIGTKRVPAAWTVWKKDALPVKDFLNTLDYFVFYQHPQAVEAFGRAVLEALASGTVVILPKHFERVFGEAALYAEPHELRELISELHSDYSIYQAQLDRSKAVLRDKFSYLAFTKLVERLLAGLSIVEDKVI